MPDGNILIDAHHDDTDARVEPATIADSTSESVWFRAIDTITRGRFEQSTRQSYEDSPGSTTIFCHLRNIALLTTISGHAAPTLTPERLVLPEIAPIPSDG